MMRLILLTILVAGAWAQQSFLSPQQQKVQHKIISKQSKITFQQWQQILRLKQEARLQQKRIRQQQLAHQERIREQQNPQQNKQTPQNQQQLVQQPSQQQNQQVQRPSLQQNQQVHRLTQQQNQQVQRPTQHQNQQVQRPSQQQNQQVQRPSQQQNQQVQRPTQQQNQQVQRPTQQQNQQVQRPSQQQNQPLIQQQSRPQPILVKPTVEILDDDRDGPFQDGTYYFRYSTGDGIQREEGARLTSPVTHEVTGSYSYVAPDGTLVAMEYIADENGFRAFPAGNGRINPILPPEPIAFPPPIRPFLNQ